MHSIAQNMRLSVATAQKTELPWAGSRHHAAVLGSNGPSLRLVDETIAPSDHVRVLGVFFSFDLILDKHVTTVSAACFYYLRSSDESDDPWTPSHVENYFVRAV